MEIVIIILVLIILAMGVWVWFLAKRNKENEAEILKLEKELEEYMALGRGLAEYNQKLQEKKEQLKEKILEMFRSSPPSRKASARRVSNKEVAKALNVSCASARRYLDELENEGKIKQVGKVGKYVYYSKI